MAKPKKTRYMCKECGAESPTWLGRCPQCGEWDSLTELARVIGKKAAAGSASSVENALLQSVATRSRPEDVEHPVLRDGGAGAPRPLAEISPESARRLPSGMEELDRVLGGGFVPGSVILVGGDPGIGKSTLLLQTAHLLAAAPDPAGGDGGIVLYVSGEESPAQVRMRAERLDSLHPKLYFQAATDLNDVLRAVDELKPRLLVLDSVQAIGNPELEAATGSVAQVRHVTQILTRAAKLRGFPLVLIGHVTKEGQIAGPRLLEHMVDAVFYFEGEESGPGRILRSVKNRFGPTHEVALFEMSGRGLLPVTDPAGFLGGRHLKGEIGSAVTISFTGTRPLAVELQTLVSAPRYGTPARVVQGIDPKRVSLLIAVLEKSAGLELGGRDLFVQVAGGLRLDDPATDAALLAALASAHTGRPLPDATLFLGEVGLRGNLRPGANLAERCLEASRLGFSTLGSPPVSGDLGNLPPGLIRETPDVRALLELSGALAGGRNRRAASP